MNKTRYAIALGATLTSAMVGCGDDEPVDAGGAATPTPFSLRFAAVAEDTALGCTTPLDGLGTQSDVSVGLSDLRFYVSDIEFRNAAGEVVAHELDENEFQYRSDAGEVALIDLTSNTDGTCADTAIAFAEGTSREHDEITGSTLVGEVTSVSFSVGVPQAVMADVIGNNTPEGAPSPLNEMFWSWTTGYRHLVFNFTVDAGGARGDGYLHIGSRGCGADDGLALEDRDACDFINTPVVALDTFSLERDVVTIDLGQLIAGLDFVAPIYDENFEIVGEGPGVECHSAPVQEDCARIFQSLGLEMDSGTANAAGNVVFSRRAADQ
ncbi:MAG: MbnP family copper-binding protein [Myxococcota bacterium]